MSGLDAKADLPFCWHVPYAAKKLGFDICWSRTRNFRCSKTRWNVGGFSGVD